MILLPQGLPLEAIDRESFYGGNVGFGAEVQAARRSGKVSVG
jgi:hypothetical protein